MAEGEDVTQNLGQDLVTGKLSGRGSFGGKASEGGLMAGEEELNP